MYTSSDTNDLCAEPRRVTTRLRRSPHLARVVFAPFCSRPRFHLLGSRAGRALVGERWCGAVRGHVRSVHAGGRARRSRPRHFRGGARRHGKSGTSHMRRGVGSSRRSLATTSTRPARPTGSTARPGGSVRTPRVRKNHRKKTRPPRCMQTLDIGSGSGGTPTPRHAGFYAASPACPPT